MMNVLYLTASEKTLFEGLDSAVRNGWKVEEEKLGFQDSPQKRNMRLHLVHLSDPTLLDVIEKAKGMSTQEEVASLVTGTDLSDVSDADLASLFFALGPVALGSALETMLRGAKTDEDIEDIAAVTTIRNGLLRSLQPAS